MRTSVHHRKPRSRGGTNSFANRVKVDPKLHNAWHILFGNLDPFHICELINAVYLDPDYIFICERRNQ